jgi:hypothetical protein
MATVHPPGTKTVRRRRPQRLGHRLSPWPLARPVAVPRACQLTHPVWASGCDTPAPLPAQHPLVKGRVGRGTMAVPLEVLYEVQRQRRPLLLTQPRPQVGPQLPYPPARFLSLGLALAHGLGPLRQLLFLPSGRLHQARHALQTDTLGKHPCHHRRRGRQTMVPMIPRLCHPPNLRATLVMGIGPIQAEHFPPAPALRLRADRPVVRPQRGGSPAGLQHPCVPGPPAAGRPRLPHLPSRDPWPWCIRTQEPARYLPTDRGKALSPATHLTIGSQTPAARLGHTHQRYHRGLRSRGEPPARLGGALFWPASPPHRRGDSRGRVPLLPTLRREAPKYFILPKLSHVG